MPVFLGISREQCRSSENHKRWERVWLTWKETDPRIDVEKWMQALSIFGPTNGLIYKEVLGEVKFREEIVEAICEGVPPESRWDDSHVQGRSRLCQVIREKVKRTEVNKSFGVRVIGVYGVGGLGKTTMCKTLCNEYSKEFQEKVAHVEFGNNGKVELMRGVLGKLTNTRREVLEGYEEGECITHLKAKLHQHNVVLAIDNVCDTNEAIEQARVYLRVGFKDGSVVIITSRSVEVLKGVGVVAEDCVKMPKLDAMEAKLLFLSQVSGVPDEIKAEDEAFIIQCVEHCRFREGDDNGLVYLPLALKLLGVESSRRGYDPKGWVEDMPHTSNNVMDSVFNILRRSFAALRDEEKLLFMDVVLYYPGYYRDGAILRGLVNIFEWLSMVHQNSVEWVKFKLLELKKKSVIEEVVDGVYGHNVEHEYVGVHDLWREFAIKETKRGELEFRQWVYVVGDEKSGFDDVEPCGNRWGKMCRMRFLRQKGSELKVVNLRMLTKLEYCSNVSVLHLMKITDIDKVEVLDLTPLKCLRSLLLQGCSKRIFDRYGGVLKYVWMLEVRGLRTLKSLAILAWADDYIFSTSMEDIASLTSLENLKLSCETCEKLPDLSDLTLLRVVHFSIEKFITVCELHGLSPKMTRLQRLSLHFDYYNGHKLSPCVCHGISNLEALEYLWVFQVKIEEVFNLQRLTKLQKLRIVRCDTIKELRVSDNLVEFSLQESLPSVQILSSVLKVTNLQILEVCNEKSIIALEGLSDAVLLQKISLSYCPNLRIIPYLGKLRNLRMLHIMDCSVQALPGLGELVALEVLKVEFCSELSEIPNLHKLSNLQRLVLTTCALKTVRGLEGLNALESLSVSGNKLVGLPELCMLEKLQYLSIAGSSSLESLPSIESLNNLKELRIDSRLVVSEWHKLPARVEELYIYGCGAEELPNSPSTKSRGDCTDLIDLNSLPTVPSVYLLFLYGCNFSAVPGLINCSALRKLEIFECHEVEGLPDAPHLEKLRIGESQMKAVPNMGFFPELKRLKLNSVTVIELPDLCSCFPNLVSLAVSYCKELVSLKSSRPLTALEKLHVIGCGSLRGLPDLRLSTKLKSLEVSECGIRLTKPHPWECTESSWPNVEWEVLP